MNNIKKEVNSRYGIFETIYNINEKNGALATTYIMLYLLEIIFKKDNNCIYCDTDSVYLINKRSECKDE